MSDEDEHFYRYEKEIHHNISKYTVLEQNSLLSINPIYPYPIGKLT